MFIDSGSVQSNFHKRFQEQLNGHKFNVDNDELGFMGFSHWTNGICITYDFFNDKPMKKIKVKHRRVNEYQIKKIVDSNTHLLFKCSDGPRFKRDH